MKIDIINVSKEELLEDFENSPEIPKSGLYQHVYTAEFGQAGGEPFGAMVSNYEFGPGPRDVALMQKVSAVARHEPLGPFIAAAGAEMFGVDDFQELPKLKDLESVFDGPAVHQVELVPRFARLPLPRTHHAALPAAAPL